MSFFPTPELQHLQAPLYGGVQHTVRGCEWLLHICQSEEHASWAGKELSGYLRLEYTQIDQLDTLILSVNKANGMLS